MMKFRVSEIKLADPNTSRWEAICSLIETDENVLLVDNSSEPDSKGSIHRVGGRIFVYLKTESDKELWQQRMGKETEINLIFN